MENLQHLADNENLFVTLACKGRSPVITSRLVIAEDVGRVKEAYEEVELDNSRNIVSIRNLSNMTRDMYINSPKQLHEAVTYGMNRLLYFNPFKDKWRLKQDAGASIFNYTKVFNSSRYLIVGIDMKEGKSYMRDVINMITLDNMISLKQVDIINAHVRNRDNRLDLYLLNPRLKHYKPLSTIFLFLNNTPIVRDIKDIKALYPNSKIYYSLENFLLTMVNESTADIVNI